MLNRLRQAPWVRRLVRRAGVHRVQTVLGLVQLPARALVGLLVARVSRDPDLVVLGSPLDRFADNAAYLYLHLVTHRDAALRAVWITGSPDVVRRLRSRGYPAQLRWSLQGVRTSLRAGTYAFSAYRSDVNGWLAPGAFALCLWHGLPIKRIEQDAEPAASRTALARALRRLGSEKPPDALLSSTEQVSRTSMAPAFGVGLDRCWHLGYPRNDHLVLAPDAPPPPALVPDRGGWDELARRRPVVGLFLTWRDTRATDVVDASLVGRLAELCGRHGAVLAYKAHFNVAAAAVESEHCVLLPPEADLNAYLGLCDVLVTDYSSVSLDFLLMRRPVVYFMPDLEEYARTRGFALDPLTLPGPITRDTESLLSALDQVLAAPAAASAPEPAAVEEFLTAMWGGYDGRAAAAITDRLRGVARPPGRRGQ